MLLQDLGWQSRNFTEMDFDMVEERDADAAEERLNSVLDQLREKRAASAARETEANTIPRAAAGKKNSEECL